jgi:YYY domain-containing protein
MPVEYVPNTGLEATYVLLWWLMLEGLGLIALPVTLRLFRHLPGRGYVFSKPLALVLVSYVLWILSTLGILRNTWGNILLSVILVLGLSVLLYRRQRQNAAPGDVPLSKWLRQNLSAVIAGELVFTLAFLLWVLYKAYDPNIAITEKPMEFAFLNAITRSDRFPPFDPWMSGYGISYYYFGYVMMATLAKFAQIPTSFAFNLGIATLFALTASGGYGVVYEMVHLVAARRTPKRAVSAAITYGILAAVLIPLMGNLEGGLEFLHANGVGVTVNQPGDVSGPFWDWIDVKNLTNRGTLSETWYPTDGWWWWRASRVIHDKGLTGGDMEVIDEFPAFSFLLGDMHPHVLAYPFVFVLIALALNLLVARDPLPEGVWWLVYLCLGAIGFLNTWDMPFYFFLLVAAYALNRYVHRDLDSPSLIERALQGKDAWILRSAPWLRQVLWRAIELALASVLLYLPYWLYSRPQAGTGILPNLFNVARFSQLTLMFGTYLFVFAVLLIVLYLDMWNRKQLTVRSLVRQGLPIGLVSLILFPLLLALVLLPVVASPSIRTYIDDALASPQVQQFLGPQTLGSLLQISLRIRLGLLPQQLREIRMPAGPWTHLVVSMLIAAILLWFVRTISARSPREGVSTEAAAVGPPSDSGPLPSLKFAMLLAFIGLMLIFSVEFLYLRDAFGTRMNTVFKFYFQAWALLGLVAAFGVYYVLEGYAPPQRRTAYTVGRWAFGLVTILLVFAGLLYPLGASIDRTAGFAGPATLDGMAFVARDHPEEYAAVAWLNEHVSGNPVISEAVRGSFAYDYARVSSRTGLPTVMGWMGHEDQWHGLYDEIRQREQDITALYAGSIPDAQRVMDKYGIDYVFVGYLERAEGEVDKFERFMDVVFRDGNTVIYKRRGE